MRRPVQIECFVFRKNNGIYEFLLLKRIESRGGFWQAVTGGVEEREEITGTVYREVFEETGITGNEIIRLIKNVYNFEFKSKGMEKIFGNINIKEFVFAIEINKSTKIRIDSKEHSGYKWVDYEQALKCLKFDTNKKALTRLYELIGSPERT